MLSFLSGMQNETATVKTVQHTPGIWPGNCTPKYLCKGNENLCSYKDLYINVYGDFI